MKIQTFSIVCGTSACNARCPFCVSKMTVENGVGLKPSGGINYRNFGVAASLALASGCATAMITSKGEPTLFPEDVDAYVRMAKEAGFPLIELQTNGIPIWDNINDPDWLDEDQLIKLPHERGGLAHLNYWYKHGLTTVAISVVHHDAEANRKNYVPYRKRYIDLEGLISNLHAIGFSVRLAVVGIKGGIDSWETILEMVDYAKEHKVEQLTWRPVNTPSVVAQGDEVAKWAERNAVPPENRFRIENLLPDQATCLLDYASGARVYDLKGQNLAITDSLTRPKGEDIRQLIFFPDGRVMFDWAYEGARLL